jgi:hypothetical protein
MADVTDAHRDRAAAVCLARAEIHLGLPMAPSGGLANRCARILAAAQRGALDARTYRLAWFLARETRGGRDD